MRKLHLQSFIYILADIVLIFGITFLAFFGSYSKDIFNSSVTGILLYCGGSALVTVIMFAILKLYHMAYENFGLADSVRVAVGYSVPALAGLVVLLTVDGLHFEVNHIIVWVLLSTTILFALAIIRALPREIKTIHRMIEKRKLGVRTMIIGAGDAAKIVIDENVSDNIPPQARRGSRVCLCILLSAQTTCQSNPLQARDASGTLNNNRRQV